jgi:hypothetical protein
MQYKTDLEARLRDGFDMLSDDDPADRRPDVEDPPVDESQEDIYDEWANPQRYEDD